MDAQNDTGLPVTGDEPAPVGGSSVAVRVHHLAPYAPAVRMAERAAVGRARVVEIGPGRCPFPPATEFVDWMPQPGLPGPVHCLDLNKDPLPFADKSIDFLYCRHVLADLYNPLHACREINRVARGGYIETPSPLAETCRGTDAGTPPPPWRGCTHRRYLVWAEGQTLLFLPKLPLIEYLQFGREEQIAELLNAGPLFWNTYFSWHGTLHARQLEHEQGFDLRVPGNNLGAQVVRALKQTVAHTVRLSTGAMKAA